MVDTEAFEQQRLELFKNHGFEGRGRRLRDRQDRMIYIVEHGEGQYPKLLIHGGLSEASEWCRLAGRLDGRVVIPDRPGCGLSYPIDYLGVDFREHAVAWLRDVIDGIDADQVDLVGNSVGGFFSIAFALAYPGRVRRLVLVGAPVGLEKGGAPLFPRLWGNPIIGPIMSKLGLLEPKDAETFRKQVFASILVVHADNVPSDFLEVAVAAAGLPGVDRAAYTMLRTITTLRGLRSHLMLDQDILELTTPTLFVWGDSDKFSLPSIGQDVAAKMPNVRIEVIRDVGHVPYLEQPEAVAEPIVNFLSES